MSGPAPKGRAASARRIARPARAVVFVLAVLAVAAFAGEGCVRACLRLGWLEQAARFRIEGTDVPLVYDATLGWRNAPGRWRQVMSDGREIPVRIDARGFRDREASAPGPADAFRVLALGDSFTWGWGVRAREAFPEVLETVLREGGRSAEVLNAGTPGWGTDQELLLLRRLGGSLDPDLVVLLLFVNDLSDNMNTVAYGTPKPVFVPAGAGLRLANVPVPRLVTGPADGPMALTPRFPFHRFAAVRVILTRAQTSPGGARAVSVAGLARLTLLASEITPPPADAVAARLIEEMAAICRRMEARFLVLLAPDSRRIGRPVDPSHPYVHLIRRLGETDLDFVDLNVVFRRRGLAQVDLCLRGVDGPLNMHYSPAGHRVVADILLAALEQRAMIPAWRASR